MCLGVTALCAAIAKCIMDQSQVHLFTALDQDNKTRVQPVTCYRPQPQAIIK